MSVIIKAKNVVFNNPNLPILTPMVSNGLVASFRPTSATLSLTDLSGNGHQLAVQGSPQFTDKSVIVDKNNGLVSDVQETVELTVMVVSRAIKTPESPIDRDKWLGFVVGTYYNDRGVSIFTNMNTTTNLVDTSGQSYAKKLTDGTIALKPVWLGSQPSTTNQTEFKFVALVINAINNKMLTYNPSVQSAPMFVYEGTPDTSLLSTRYLADPATGTPNYFKLGIANVPFGDGKAEIAEVLIYNRALSQEEIMRQYQYSKDFMLKHRSIAI